MTAKESSPRRGHGEKAKIESARFRDGPGHLDRRRLPGLLAASSGSSPGSPIAEGLDKRERRVADQIAQAAGQHEEARGLLAEYQQKLAAAEARSAGSSSRAAATPSRSASKSLEKAKARPDLEHQRALREIDAATAGAIKELAEQSADPGRRAGRQDRSARDSTPRTTPG